MKQANQHANVDVFENGENRLQNDRNAEKIKVL